MKLLGVEVCAKFSEGAILEDDRVGLFYSNKKLRLPK